MRVNPIARRTVAATVTLLLSLMLAGECLAEPVEFVVIGDMPYGQAQLDGLPYLGRAIRKAGIPFVIHYGDLKSGRESCRDELLAERRDAILRLVDGGVFYTPGDNDWTDCDRRAAGGYDELERLDKLRGLFFTRDLPSKAAWGVVRQLPDYPENARWTHENLQLATLHIVGTDNGRHEIEKTNPRERALDAVDARDAANLVWLDAAFEHAHRDGRDGLVVAIHADPGELEMREHRARSCSRSERTACNPYRTFLRRLTEQADRFDRPVLLVHGSTNQFCLDRGFGGWEAPALWRLNGPGDFTVIDAAVVHFDPTGRSPFAVYGLLTGEPAPECTLAERLR